MCYATNQELQTMGKFTLYELSLCRYNKTVRKSQTVYDPHKILLYNISRQKQEMVDFE